MILKRYGSKLHSVRPNFDANAMTEIGFMKDNEQSYEAEAFAQEWEQLEVRELKSSSEGHVQSLVEHAVLHSLEEQVLDMERDQQPHGVLVIENEQGKEQPKTKGTQRSLVEGGENRTHFQFVIEPALRVGLYRRKS